MNAFVMLLVVCAAGPQPQSTEHQIGVMRGLGGRIGVDTGRPNQPVVFVAPKSTADQAVSV